MHYNPLGRFVKVSALSDEDGQAPPVDLNPPVGRELKKVVGSRKFPPKEEDEDPKEAPASRQ